VLNEPGQRPVRYQPVLPLAAALGAGERFPAPFPLDQRRLLLTFSGTAAIAQAFEALGLPRGATVLCPSFNCGHEIEPLVRLGLRVECYRVGPDLQADLGDIERRLGGGARALLITHYFGFAQPLADLRALCDRFGIYLVEDCAHGFLSDDASGMLGRTGDLAVYSFRKSLPVPNGGAVLANSDAVALPPRLRRPPRLTTWLKGLALARKGALDRARDRGAVVDILTLAALAPAVAGSELLERFYPGAATACYDPDDDDLGFDSSILGWGIAPYSAGLLRRLDWRGIADRRRHNYRVLADGLRRMGAEALLPDVEDYTCPLFLPLLVERRLEVFKYLIDRRIYSAVWWDQPHPAVDWSEFPDAAELKQRVLALPVHQDVDDERIERMLTALRDCPALGGTTSFTETGRSLRSG
jgi:dTDP-4-amino-4,6-dideoxygalactose transaminase